jgi:DASH complex subunit SPC19
LQRVDNYLGKVERKVNGTRARSELLEGRLEGGEGLKKKRSLDRLVRKSSLTKMSGGRGGASEERALRYVLYLYLLLHFLG